MAEQAAAFYDYRQKKLYLLESTAGSPLEQTALVHEIAHALADQHFHLEKFIRGASQTDDGSLARVAVMEGQATWIMTEYTLRKSNLSLVKSPAMAEMMASDGERGGSSGAFPVLEGAPLYLRQSLIFPYTHGMRFQQKVIEKRGSPAAFTEVFRKPPVSTQEILHPERYLDRGGSSKPRRPQLPHWAAEKSYKGLAEGGVGEFDHGVLLEQYAGKETAERLSPHWRSGFYRLYEGKNDRNSLVLAYAVEWDSEALAAEYFDAYRGKVLPGKWKNLRVAEERGGTVVGEGDDGWFVLRRQSARVTSLEGLANEAAARAALN
jgi:hypothetical protein